MPTSSESSWTVYLQLIYIHMYICRSGQVGFRFGVRSELDRSVLCPASDGRTPTGDVTARWAADTSTTSRRHTGPVRPPGVGDPAGLRSRQAAHANHAVVPPGRASPVTPLLRCPSVQRWAGVARCRRLVDSLAAASPEDIAAEREHTPTDKKLMDEAC